MTPDMASGCELAMLRSIEFRAIKNAWYMHNAHEATLI